MKQLTQKTFEITQAHIDVLKHVNYQVYIKHFELGRFDWFEQNNLSFQSLLDRNLTFVLKKLETTYIKEVCLGDKQIVETKLGQKGNSSFSMEQIMYNQAGDKVAETKSLMVMFDMKNRHSIPVIPEIAQLFE